ncbi:Serine--tRNA ligase, mitochondrial [Pseudocercospora fuligena]|uniref:serine--tRNA ligase n=1 Tax=Pseudocercospora fuligena TaxID=685502 RepID=A0A8H6R9R3_9PEZI|nr:Serine--tRNA ligase, mitochondrial [Pseudocercospora fuligena]
MERLALELPNLSSVYTPVGEEPVVREEIGTKPSAKASAEGHVEIGKELDILDFEASATTSGWGWYFLKNEGALLEQALIQYALSVAMKRGWKVMTPPSLVYEHIAHACGFMPRDQNGETQIYEVKGEEGHDRPKLVLAGTAEIPFAGSLANKTLNASELPLKVIGPSRCYRAEAGARGVDTKGLYRVHEFTKVEMFAWTVPPPSPEEDRFGAEQERDQSEQVFEEMLEIQKEILSSLGLHAKVLEMPTSDLGASATRKIDIEAFFPSRQGINDGYGEVTSVSVCTDYQSRRLATRLKGQGGKLGYPHTVNGTAMAVPRVLACLIENHYDETEGVVRVPGVMKRFLPEGMDAVGRERGEDQEKVATLIDPEGLHAGYTKEHFHGRPGVEDGVVRERGE